FRFPWLADDTSWQGKPPHQTLLSGISSALSRVISVCSGTFDQFFLSTFWQNLLISHWKTTSIPAFSRPRSNPPIPAKYGDTLYCFRCFFFISAFSSLFEPRILTETSPDGHLFSN